ncbi:fibronectin type III domain-containing protein [Hymenobacter negativus]|uniref:Fibronectin type III domain-containing protein n=1 Tax=Hymenobacter negativus TaxID=2795026 RepID=A0ABS3Q975_9BACT|nr:fibronectin type III domain-containing protein [Hymenobacter negativus]MBO2007800.1 fibronectin type III domain-containing protein [Hymenobacter negativus]
MHTPLFSRQRMALSWSLVLAALLGSSLQAEAQVDQYTFAPSTGTYTSIATAAGATNVPTVQADSGISPALPLGFSFVFDGVTYTQVKASSNGFLSFNTGAVTQTTNNLNTVAAASRPLVAPLWDDLDGRATVGGVTNSSRASYLTTGVAPNRVFTFEWKDWEWNWNSTTPVVSFQAKLYEGTNVVQFVYAPGTGSVVSGSASVGLSGVAVGEFLSLSSLGTAPTVSSTTETTNIATQPAAGQTYTFTPPVPALCPTPRQLAVTGVTNTTASVSYSVSNTTPGPFTILYGPTGFNPAALPSSTNVYSSTTATSLTPTLTGLTANTTYQFYVIQNCGGSNGTSSISNAGTFTTNPNPAANDNCAQAIALTIASSCTTPVSGTVVGATQTLAPSTGCGGTVARDVWYSFVAGATSVQLATGAQFTGYYDVRSGSCTTSTSVACGLLGTTTTPTQAIVPGLAAGQTYFLRIYSSATTAPAITASGFTVCLTPAPTAPANDDCAGALNIPIQYGTCVGQTSADNTAATNSTGAPAPTCANYQGKDLWFTVTVPASGQVTVQTVTPTAGSPITDTGMSIYSGTCSALTEVECDDDDSPTGNFSLITLTGRTPGEVLYVRVWEYGGGTTGLIAVCATSPSNCGVPTGPAVSNLTNTTATLSWVAPSNGLPAGGSYELEYGPQGFTQGTGTVVTGLTATTYALSNLAANFAYCFYVRTNCGTANGSSTWVGPTCFNTPLTAPANDDPCGATTLGGTVLAASNVGATTTVQATLPNPVCSTASQPKDVWFAFTPTGTTATLTLTGSAAGTVRVYASPSCSAGPFTLMSCASSGANNTALTTPVSVTGLTAGQRYYVAVSGYGSSDTQGSFTITGAGLVTATRVQADTDALLVYPNPSNTGQLTLKLSGLSGAGQATLLNSLGQVVLTKNLTAAAEQTLNTRNLAAGLYTLRVEAGSQVLTRKVVLE